MPRGMRDPGCSCLRVRRSCHCCWGGRVRGGRVRGSRADCRRCHRCRHRCCWLTTSSRLGELLLLLQQHWMLNCRLCIQLLLLCPLIRGQRSKLQGFLTRLPEHSLRSPRACCCLRLPCFITLLLLSRRPADGLMPLFVWLSLPGSWLGRRQLVPCVCPLQLRRF